MSHKSETKRSNVNSNLLDEFPTPKRLLWDTISRSVRADDCSHLIQYRCTEEAGVKKARVTVLWPCKIVEEGFASKKADAEKIAAAAACQRLKEMGVIGPNPEEKTISSHRKTMQEWSPLHDSKTENILLSRKEQERWRPSKEDESNASEALSLFPLPKDLLSKVFHAASTAKSSKELLVYNTVHKGSLKMCELTVMWPKKMTFTATSRSRLQAERKAAALACVKYKELGLLDENNKPLTHAKYNPGMVREAIEKDRQPVQLEVPKYLENEMIEYLSEFPVEAEMQMFETEKEEAEEPVNQEDEELLLDAITGRPYRPMSKEDIGHLNTHLQQCWESANPRLIVELPVDAHRQRLVSAVQSSKVVVIAGETGCGKTTRIPRFLLEERVRGGEGAECNILVTQPRRISAVSVAHRVAQELGPNLKHSVGYQVRLESRPPDHSGGAMLFLTVGVLLRKLQSNPTLEGISHVIVDEVHERDINTDLLLALLRTSLTKNPNLRVVLMSATGDNIRLAEYFGGAPIVKVPGFMHPVRERYLTDVLLQMGRSLPTEESEKPKKKGWEVSPDLDLVADVIEHIDKHGEPGAILCFLSGWQDIKAVKEKLEQASHFSSGSQMILPLHSSLSVAEQQRVFVHPQVGQRKIVLTTNIAETSVTIDDVVHVVDTGTHKEHFYDPSTKISSLDTTWISQSNVTQRKGRAGRCQPGQSYHLFSKTEMEAMTPFPIPEIMRTSLENLVVQTKIHSPNCKAADFLSQVLDSPEKQAVEDAVQKLQVIGVLDKNEKLTTLGERVASISCDPQLGKALVLSAMFRCVLPMLSIVASLARDPFHNSLQNRALVSQAKESLNDSSYSDYLVFSRAVLGWRQLQRNIDRADRDNYLEKYKLSRAGLRFIKGLMSQFSENMCDAGLVSQAKACHHHSSLYNEHSDQDELLKAVLLAGLYPNLIQVRKGIVTKTGRFRPNQLALRTLSGPVLLHQTTVNRGKKVFPSRWMTFFTAVKSNEVVFIRDSSVVHPLALLLLTECDITETVSGDMVEVSLCGNSLVRCSMPEKTWELLWELRMSIHMMLYRNLKNPNKAVTSKGQDGRLISLLVELLNNTTYNPSAQTCNSDSEVD
ncbi:ATP-dependent RNA helicase DHX30 [Aulostomus maculatus]